MVRRMKYWEMIADREPGEKPLRIHFPPLRPEEWAQQRRQWAALDEAAKTAGMFGISVERARELLARVPQAEKSN